MLLTLWIIEENDKAIVIQRIYRKKKNNKRGNSSINIESPLPKVVINKPEDEEIVFKEQNEKATLIQRKYREKKSKQKKVEVDEVLGMPIDDEMQDKAAYIQRHYRNKKAKEG